MPLTKRVTTHVCMGWYGVAADGWEGRGEVVR